YSRARSSAVSPMIRPQTEQVNPSRYIASTSVTLPILWPQRASSLSTRYGMRDIDSMPPASTIADSPSRIDCAPVAVACIPDAPALLIVWAGTLSGTPARTPTCRAGLGPDPAWRAWPIRTSPISSGATPARSSAARAATAPSSAGWTFRSAPPYLPIGVRAAPTMKTSVEAITSKDTSRGARALESQRIDPIQWIKSPTRLILQAAFEVLFGVVLTNSL